MAATKKSIASKGVRRPHVWASGPDEYRHSMYIPWLRAKAQAAFRNEPWDLTFEDFFKLWDGKWHQRGRSAESLAMTRHDPDLAWTVGNVEVINRAEQCRRQNNLRGDKPRGPYKSKHNPMGLPKESRPKRKRSQSLTAEITVQKRIIPNA